jgi:uncharacterized protein YecA (UPF0149 family)
MHTQEFLQAERDHAERHLTRLRRIATAMRAQLEQAGLDEVAVYERLITNKAHRQLQRDEAFYQQMWLRINRHLEKLEPPKKDKTTHFTATPAPPPQEVKLVPYRKPFTPGPNQKCLCGSNLKYKRCCGNPLRQAAA